MITVSKTAMFKSKILFLSFLILILVGVFFGNFSEAKEDCICLVYITGIGCPNCAVTDPIVLSEWTLKYPNLVVIEYEIYKNHQENYPTADEYFKNYTPLGIRPGVPFLILNREDVFLGRFEVLETEKKIEKLCENPEGEEVPYGAGKFPLSDTSCQKFEDLDINNLPGEPNIWANGRILIPIGERKTESDFLRELLFEDDIFSILESLDYEIVAPESISLSGKKVNFDNALLIGGWRFQWNGESLDKISESAVAAASESLKNEKTNWSKLFYLALIVIFALIFLISIYKKKKNEPNQ